MTVLKVKDMHCGKCVARIDGALKEIDAKYEINLAEKTVTVLEGEVAKVIEELDDLGFTAE